MQGPSHQDNSTNVPENGKESKAGSPGDLLQSMLQRSKDWLLRVAYGPGANLGSSNDYIYDSSEGKWKPRSTDGVTSDCVRQTSEAAAAGSPVDIPASAGLGQPVPFGGVFGKKSTNGSRAQVDMATLAHPVYAPTGGIYTADASLPTEPVIQEKIEHRVVRTSPFG
jgi:hypothetical protein